MTTSLPVFPNNLIGLEWNVTRSSMFSTRVMTSRSGKEYRAANWSFGKYKYSLSYSVLRTATAYQELQTLMAFVNNQAGMFGPFAYSDPNDNAVVAQGLGTGNGVQTVFPLVRAYGGYVDPVTCALAVANVYSNGDEGGGWTATQVGSYGTDSITFASAPANGVAITATFTYYWPCRFLQDEAAFNNFMNGRFEVKKLEFQTVK